MRIECVSKSDHLDLFHPQVLWQSTGQTYWMRWHMLEIIGFGDQWEDPAAQEKERSLIESSNLDTGETMCCMFISVFSLILLWRIFK